MTTAAATPTPATYTDRAGQCCLWVPLSNSPDSWTTTVDAYRELMQTHGITEPFRFQYRYRAARQVVVNLPSGDAVEVSRLIAKAGPTQRVRFDNKQSTDLRPRNLVLIDGAPTHETQKPGPEAAAHPLE